MQRRLHTRSAFPCEATRAFSRAAFRVDAVAAQVGRGTVRFCDVQPAPEHRDQALVLRYYNDLDDRAIADAMGIKVGSVRSLAARALEALRIQRLGRARHESVTRG
ncbi:sigma-70 region 4 domain-containing protein [Aeromicrobium senzhongii]|uniref:Sigma-70 region 4 domain-containing protein n=1 Tax=Aeromicrobium senzhongii TaxID=2663859 RepID=A0ABX6SVA1_9ACTN|nr:sigma factor-like helix-turn-helix DNA-binding protein [Aeromicrobium senzhongii]MTB89492.1 hypothetical protein [Aeromicrobium senzhongii]QNL94374.1 sigma-70 region 4 domain-containing protein [Aeromicrobium senzhongii]